jgi:hypothetical protein
MGPSKRLPEEVIKLITAADTVFIASIYRSEVSTAEKYPSHAGINARGGLPGFMRVCPSDGRTVVLPDYSGNRFLSSLGNIESTGLAGLTIVSFTTGDVLYLTGTAHVLVGPSALDIMARQTCITVIETTGYMFIRDAFLIRQEPGTDVERSPYSPKIKYLVEEPEALANMLYNLEKADWKVFSQKLLELDQSNEFKWGYIESETNLDYKLGLDQEALHLQEIIKIAADSAIPRKNPFSRSKAWWSDKLTRLRKLFGKARKL